MNPDKLSLSDWLLEWLDTYKCCTVKPRTAEMYRYIIKLIQAVPLSRTPLLHIHEGLLQNILNSLYLQGYSKSVLTKVRLTLRQSIRPLVRRQALHEDHSAFLTVPAAPEKKILPLTQDEQMLIENACSSMPLGHLILFFLRTGLRRAELMNLKWADVDARCQEIHIRVSKSPAGVRTVPLVPQAMKIIEAQPHFNDYVFNNTQHRPIQAISLRRLYERVRKITGIQTMTNHVCRHTFVTRLCEQNVDAKSISQLIGHAKPDYVLSIYAYVESKQLRKAVNKLADGIKQDKQVSVVIEIPEIYAQQFAVLSKLQGRTVNECIESYLINSLNKKSLNG